ncbi:SMI1/KNR4 family protein [Candidatus Methylacidiphilum infernorum]|uniref:SMI1/KNR4 family protein n=1 Tax=Candidatus Methylacidiphilum infernorum TaxID=511746 RepID=A0ABX7PV99_9BACT|nr:YrhA family protein [Candidatus Methylacidiphilum infernorum]QSR86603.1 SMI1/KNR4 family protein [Candidatus Methylacidiphilum infernorum]
MKYLQYLEMINQEEVDAGFEPLRGRPTEKILAYRDQVKEQYGIEIPDDYLEFLKVSDGLAHNGVVFFSTDHEKEEFQVIPGLISENLSIGTFDQNKDYLILGYSNLFWYAYHFPTQKYLALDEEDLQEVVEFKDFDDMMTSVLKYEVLEMLDEEEEAEEEEAGEEEEEAIYSEEMVFEEWEEEEESEEQEEETMMKESEEEESREKERTEDKDQKKNGKEKQG